MVKKLITNYLKTVYIVHRINYYTMTNYENLPISRLINELNITDFEALKTELQKTDDNEQKVYKVDIKEDDNVACIFYTDHQQTDVSPDDSLAKQIEDTCRSHILEKSSLKPLSSQFNKILYNNNAVLQLNNTPWEKTQVFKCYEGTMVSVFYHDKWYVSTRRCLDSSESTWVKGKSHRDMFDEACAGCLDLETLDKDNAYHFVLVHHKNKNIVNYSASKDKYSDLYHIMTTEKYTLNEVDYVIDNVKKMEPENFESLAELDKHIGKLSKYDEESNTVTQEGYVLRAYSGEIGSSPFTVLKLQTPIYQKLSEMKPNNSNIHQNYLELYQKDKLVEFLPYFESNNHEVVGRIHRAMQNVSKEILNLYHSTRNKMGTDMYSKLHEGYRKVLYELHGMYINKRKKDFASDTQVKVSRSINVHDVYHHLKEMSPKDLRQIFYERTFLLPMEEMVFLNKQCIYTKTQSVLMFGGYNLQYDKS